MNLSIHLHQFIERNSPLNKWAGQTRTFLLSRPHFYKVALVVNHLFRTALMAAFFVIFPSALCACLAGSLFYRLTVENNCAYKFALPSFGGACAYLCADRAATRVITGAAFASLKAFAWATASFLPLAAYLGYIVLTVSYDVDAI